MVRAFATTKYFIKAAAAGPNAGPGQAPLEGTATPPTAFTPPSSPPAGDSTPPPPGEGASPPAVSPPPELASPPALSPPPALAPPPPVDPLPSPPPELAPPPAATPVVSPPPPLEQAPPPAIESPPPALAPPPDSPPPAQGPPPESSPAAPPAKPPATPPSSPLVETPPPSNVPPPSQSPPPEASPPPSEVSPPPFGAPPPSSPPPWNSPPAPTPITPTASPPVLAPSGVTPARAPSTTIPRIFTPDFNPPPPPRNSAPPVPGPPPASTGVASSTLVVGAAVGAIAVLFILICLVVCCCRKKRRTAIGDDGFSYKGSSIATMPLTGTGQYKSSDTPDAWGIHSSGSTNASEIPPPPSGSDKMGNSRSYFTYSELAVATDNFSKDNLLGEGGFGRVYKGKLPNGTVVAVKQLTVGGGQGEREFRAEVEVISRVHHRHLVSLVGYCVADRQRLLVYEFVPNGTLENNLHNPEMPIMEWSTRLKIGLGCARGLAYLHEDCHPKIIHRDIKSSNILLEENFEAQVADFGLAKLSSDTNTHVSTRVMGTFGYLAPEYAASGKLTDRSDVFSFGVVLLELVTGRRPIDMSQEAGFESLVEWARPVVMRILEDGHLEDLVDPNLDGNYDRDEMLRVIETAAACVRHSALKRPRMAQVVRALESDSDRAGLYQGMKPGQSMESESQYGSECGGAGRYGSGDSGQFDSSPTDDYGSTSGLRSFHKQTTNVSRHPANLPSIHSSEHPAIAEESGEFDQSEFVRSESTFKPPVFGTQQFNPPKFQSGEYDPDAESSDLPGAFRTGSKKNPPPYAPPRPVPPNNGMSGFMGAPPPPPGRYSKPFNYSGEDYVPIGKTVSFAPNVEEKKF